jgi:aminoglycoside phosphotransferase (APT) family kinase protein
VFAAAEIVGVLRSPHAEVLMTAYEGRVDFADVVEKETIVLQALAAAGVPVPRVLAWERRHAREGRSWILLEHIAHEQAPRFGDALQRELGSLTGAIHAIDGGALLRQRSWGAYVTQRLRARVDAAAGLCDLPSANEISAAVEPLLAARGEPHALLHMDLREANVCVRNGRIAGVIDLANALAGDPLIELARIRSYGLLTPAFLAGYGTTEAKLAEHAQLLDAYELDTAALLAVVAVTEADDQRLFTRMKAAAERLARRVVA